MPAMFSPAPVDERIDCLRRAAWSFDWCSLAAPGGGERFLVDAANGENALRAEGAALAEPLWPALARGATATEVTRGRKRTG
jgi:hypothetical protein